MTVIGILECGRNKPEWLAEHGGFADWFPPLLHPVDPTLKFRVWRADQNELPPGPDACDVWLLTGSPASTYQDMPWQRALSAFVVAAKGVRPMIGICYGHQHIHAALGGKVEKAPKWGVGITPYAIDSWPDWFTAPSGEGAKELRLIALHQDHVTVPAPDTQVLASNPQCPFAVTLIGPDILTFQPHPEMTPEQVTKIYDLHRPDMGDAQWSAAQHSLTDRRDHQLAARMIVDFIRSTQERREEANARGNEA